MSSPRRLPDLCLITVFQQLSPNEQVAASRVSSRWCTLLRAANRRVRSLVITCTADEDTSGSQMVAFQNYLYNCFVGSSISMQQVTNKAGQQEYPKTTRLSKWNCLQYRSDFDLPTIERIVNIFSAVTDLKISLTSSKHVDFLVILLQHSNWSHQLRSFVFFENYFWGGTNNRFTDYEGWRLFTAINSLSALQYLAIYWARWTQIHDLSILDQLKVISIGLLELQMPSFLDSIERYTAKNVHLQVQFYSVYSRQILSLSLPFLDRITRISTFSISSNAYLMHLGSHFTSLTSLSLYVNPRHFKQLFTSLLPLTQLVHLRLEIDALNENEVEDDDDLDDNKFKFDLFSRPQVQLKSVKALDLELTITDHSQVPWFSLQWTLPNLQCIYIDWLDCKSCKVNSQTLCNQHLVSESLTCFRSILSNLHPSVHPSQIYLHDVPGSNLYSSAETIFANKKTPRCHKLYTFTVAD